MGSDPWTARDMRNPPHLCPHGRPLATDLQIPKISLAIIWQQGGNVSDRTLCLLQITASPLHFQRGDHTCLGDRGFEVVCVHEQPGSMNVTQHSDMDKAVARYVPRI